MSSKTGSLLRGMAAIAGLALLAACKTGAPEPRIIATAPPPPLEPQVIPYRPLPPGGASPTMPIPALGADGVRQTVISHMNPVEAVWNFRSAWNVAALNCREARYQPVLDGYRQLLERHDRRLDSVNAELDRQFRREHGGQATRQRESYMTQVYNYFAMPPAHGYFCEAALQIANDAQLTQPTDLDAFALEGIQRMASAFERFYRDFEQYQIDVAVWDAQYAPLFQQGPLQQQAVTYADAGVTEAGFDSTGRVQLSAPATGAEPVSRPVIQPLPLQGQNY